MEQFKYYAPTKILFGKNTEAEVGELCKTQGASKVLVHFGGSSAKKSGLLDRVCGALQECRTALCDPGRRCAQSSFKQGL